MPKSKKPAPKRTGKNKKPNIFSSRRNQLIILCVALVAVVTIFVPLYQKNQAVKAEKQDFLTKQSQLQDIANKISAANKPDEQKSKAYCARTSGFKYDKGDLYCVVRTELTYSGVAVDEASAILNHTVADLNLKLQQSGVPSSRSTKFEPSDKQNDNQSYYSKLNIDTENCSISYYFDAGLQSDKTLRVVLSCQKPSLDVHFPLEK